MEKSEPDSEIEETGNYLGLSLIRAPKKNHKSIEHLAKPIVQWFKKQGARPEIYHLSTSEFPEGIESIAKTLSTAEDNEEVWVLLQFYRPNSCRSSHCKDDARRKHRCTYERVWRSDQPRVKPHHGRIQPP